MIFSKVKSGFLLFILLNCTSLLAQNTGVSDVARTPDASAVLDVFSTSKGMLVPRVTEAQRTTIATPATGLLVYQINGTTPGFYYYTGTTWTPIASGSGSRWTLEPNSTNIYYNSGFVGVGVTNPRNQLVVSNSLEIRRTGTATTDISQLLFTNTASQGNFRIGSDGNDIFWQGGGSQALQMGSYWTTILSGDRQLNTFPSFITGSTIPNRSVLIRSSRDISIPLTVQGNSATQTGNLTEWLNSAGTTLNVINSTGNLGLGLTAPTQKLDVTGNFRLTGAFMPNGNAGTAGQVLQSTGANASPVWVSAGASSGWALGGNSVAALNTFGTTTAFDLPFITNNTEKMRILSGGNVGIGTTIPAEKLEINGNLRLSAAATTTPRRIVFSNTGSDPDAVIETRPGGSAEQQEMLFYVGNDPANSFGPDRIRMVAEEIRFQNFNVDANSSLANAESQPTSLNTRMIITPAGNVGIGTTEFDEDSPEQLLVEADPSTYNGIVARGNINSYFQTNIQNLSTGSQASSDVVATANNGTETTNFIDMGINNSNYVYQNGNAIETGKANDGYILSAGQDFYLVNNNPTKDMIFTVGGTATTNEAMRITGAGERVGIANSAPNSTLSVGGSLTMAVRTTAVSTTLVATDHVVIYTGTSTTWVLPAANSCRGRIYRIVNHGSGALNISPAIIIGSGGASASSLNPSAAVEIISDGTNWRRMDD